MNLSDMVAKAGRCTTETVVINTYGDTRQQVRMYAGWEQDFQKHNQEIEAALQAQAAKKAQQ